MKKYLLFFLFCCCFMGLSAQSDSTYVLLRDATDFPRQRYQAQLNTAAEDLAAVFEGTSLNQETDFKIFDFGFYLHKDKIQNGIPEAFEQIKTIAARKAPYYLLFAKQSDEKGLYSKFLVDLKLPEQGISLCLDVVATDILRQIIENKVNEVHTANNRNVYRYYLAEIEAMHYLKTELDKRIRCCKETDEGIIYDCREKEIDCFNGIDDDGDGYIDCEDLDCYNQIYGNSLKNNQAKARYTDCSICPMQEEKMMKQMIDELLFQIEDGKLKAHWSSLKKIYDLYARCKTQNWKSYKNKGIVPQCIWETGTQGIAFQSGIVDGVYGETKAIIDFIVQYDQTLETIAGFLLQISVAVNRDKFGCNDEERICNYIELVERIRKDIACTLSCEEIELAKNKIFEPENILKGCELLEELALAIKNITEFIDNEEEITRLTLKLKEEINKILAEARTGNTEVAYKAGKLMGIVALNLIPISKISKAEKVKDLLNAIKKLKPKQLDNLVDYVSQVTRGVIKLPDDELKYAFDGDGILLYSGVCFSSPNISSARFTCRRWAVIDNSVLFIKNKKTLESVLHEGFSKRRIAQVNSKNSFTADEVQKKALKLQLEEINHLLHSSSGKTIKQLLDDIVAKKDNKGILTENLTDLLFSQNGYSKIETKLGSNNGFDGVYIKKDASGNIEDIIIAEAKPMNQGAIRLSTGLNARGTDQMSTTWINLVIDDMIRKGGQLEANAKLIRSYIQEGKVRKIVTAVE